MTQTSESAWIHHVDTLVPLSSPVFQCVPPCSTFRVILWIMVVEWKIEKRRRTPGNPSNKLQNSYREFDSHTRLQFHPLNFQRVAWAFHLWCACAFSARGLGLSRFHQPTHRVVNSLPIDVGDQFKEPDTQYFDSLPLCDFVVGAKHLRKELLELLIAVAVEAETTFMIQHFNVACRR